MKIVLINGTNHKGSTYNIAHNLALKVGGEIKEFFLPKDFDSLCLGCTTCFAKDEHKCPHYEKLKPLTEALLESDLIILASPVYVYHVTGAMKAFLDHYGYMWMAHRPEEVMFKKQALVVSTAAGAGMKSTNKDMADSLYFWGVAKTYKMGYAVRAVDWNFVTPKLKNKIEKKSNKIAKKIIKRNGKIKPGFKTKAFFFLMHLLERNGWNQADVDYWKEKGWTGKVRPWKKRK